MSQKTAFFIVIALKTSNLVHLYIEHRRSFPSEMFESTYKPTEHQNPKDHNMNIDGSKMPQTFTKVFIIPTHVHLSIVQ
jgi:hypothetical protein